MLNRTTAPEFKQVNEINFIAPKAQQLANGIKVFTVNAGQQELVRIEFIFENVNYDQSKPLQAVTVNSLINNGTKTLTDKEIAEKVDYYGAFLQTEYGADHTTITLHSLNKHLVSVLPIVWSIFNESIFPQHELDIFIQNQKQKLQVNLQKNDFLARKTFANTIFGNTAYGSDIAAADYDTLNRADLLAYFKAAYKPENCIIVAAGKFEEKEFQLLNQFFGQSWENAATSSVNQFHFSAVKGSEIYIEKDDAVQSALRLGNLTINRKHQDFAKLQILNTLLGGYFGSRLMANIREEKGYTYGIGSGIASLKHAGYFFIATEVGTAVCASALTEIEKEINVLKSDLVSAEELDLVRNYMLGSLLGSLENAFSHADKFKNLYFSGLDYSYYSDYIQTVKTISPEEIKAVANEYLDWNAMTKVVVGKK
ncbi:M16 family metallopeptidase [Pedobacter cryotolerans]|uniref:Insulinase family protein n=1 Tax=Pedobacter cryotolerans TaxID=2571270 RepID=A0A4U1CCE4_9SPHI|nr:pitrilysin family protein [Pedobacter cryotolerans]TKC01480.1 insulinase family protein [Pedobacter cryotolerans]